MQINHRLIAQFSTIAGGLNTTTRVCLNCDLDSLTEDVSDRCLGELMGVGVKPVKCSISSECIRIMTQLGRTGYHLTHQLLYGMLAEQVIIVMVSL